MSDHFNPVHNYGGGKPEPPYPTHTDPVAEAFGYDPAEPRWTMSKCMATLREMFPGQTILVECGLWFHSHTKKEKVEFMLSIHHKGSGIQLQANYGSLTELMEAAKTEAGLQGNPAESADAATIGIR